jgi:hypothetical protein
MATDLEDLMIEDAIVDSALQPPPGWVDTPEQAQLRACLSNVLKGHDEANTIRVCYDIITLLRDQLMTQTAQVRRRAAGIARETMTPAQLVEASGQSRATVARLLTEARNS